MIRATTPTLTLIIPDEIDLTEPVETYVTFAQDEVSITKSVGSDLEIDSENNCLLVYLSQEETLQFKANSQIKVQVNWMYADGSRQATKIKHIMIDANLLDKVIET